MILLLQPMSMGTSHAQYLSQEELDKERIQLEKQRKIFDENLQTIQSQINELSSILNNLKNNNISKDKIEDVEEQLEELYDDKSKLEKSESDLLEREAIFKKNWNSLPITTSTSEDTSEPTSIPPWFKSNAKWWKEGLISDGDIINALESLIIQDIIPLDNFVKESSGIEHVAGISKGGTFTIPSYQKDVFGYWSDGQVSDTEIVNSIGFLMNEGIINSAKIQTEIAEKQTKFEQKMAQLDAELDSDSKFMSNIDGDDGSVTVMNPDGSKTVTFEDKTSTTFFKDGSRVTHYPEGFVFDEADTGPVGFIILRDAQYKLFSHYVDGSASEVNIEKLVTNADGTRSVYEFRDYDSYESSDNFSKAISSKGLIINHDIVNSIINKSPESTTSDSSGEMQQLISVSAFSIGGQLFPVSQFTLWKQPGECDNAWHYHTNTGQAVSFDSLTKISDPDQANCGFGKAGVIFVTSAYLSQAQIDKFKKLTGYDPLTGEAMMGGSDTGSNTVDEGPAMTSTEEDVSNDWTPYTGPNLSTWGKSNSAFTGDEFADYDGDGIEDDADPEPEIKNNEFGGEKSENKTLLGKIIDRGDLTVTVSQSTEGAVLIEVGTDGNSESVIIEIMGVEIEVEAGTIFEASFG